MSESVLPYLCGHCGTRRMDDGEIVHFENCLRPEKSAGVPAETPRPADVNLLSEWVKALHCPYGGTVGLSWEADRQKVIDALAALGVPPAAQPPQQSVIDAIVETAKWDIYKNAPDAQHFAADACSRIKALKVAPPAAKETPDPLASYRVDRIELSGDPLRDWAWQITRHSPDNVVGEVIAECPSEQHAILIAQILAAPPVAKETPAPQREERRKGQRRSEGNTPRSEAGPERRSWMERRVAPVAAPQGWTPPRYQLHVQLSTMSPFVMPFDGDPNETGAWVKWSDIAHLFPTSDTQEKK